MISRSVKSVRSVMAAIGVVAPRSCPQLAQNRAFPSMVVPQRWQSILLIVPSSVLPVESLR